MATNTVSQRTWIVYRIECAANGKLYFGITSQTLARRWWQHQNTAKRIPNWHLHRAIRKYGAESFVVEIIQRVATTEEAHAAERYLISRHSSLSPDGYNLTHGGQGTLGYRAPPELRARMVAYRTGRPSPRKGTKLTPEWIENLRLSHQGSTLTPQHKAAISAAHKGRELSEKELANLTFGRNGERHSPATCAKMSAARLGKKIGPHSASTKQKMSEAARRRGWCPSFKGRSHNAESRIKIGEAGKGRPTTLETRIKMAAARGRLAGAHYRAKRNVWEASIRINGKYKHLGTFRSEEAAHAAYIAVFAVHGIQPTAA